MSTIKEMRERNGWSQVELSQRSGVGVATISRVENGEDVLRSTMTALCSALGIALSDVTGVNIVNRVANRRSKV